MSETTASVTALPVLIIGAGLGGLNLANSLQKHNIPYKLFERDSAQSQRAQGYRISMDGGGGGGADGLRAALSPELFDLFEKTCGEQNPVGGRVDGPSGKLLQAGVMGLLGAGGWGLIWALGSRILWRKWAGWTWAGSRAWLWSWFSRGSSPPPGPTVPAGADKRYQVDRRMLRSILLTAQYAHITYNAAFTSYTLSSDSVTAHFADGTSATGSLLVGADGTWSRVAAQLIGHAATPRDLGFRIIYGKTPLTPEVEEALHPTLQKGVSFVTDTTADGQRVTLVIESMWFTHPGAPQNYIFWALCVPKDLFGDDEHDDVGLLAARLTEKWDPRIRVIFDQQALEETAALRMTTSSPDGPPTWQTERRVTVLGDAVHCMPPTGGQGGNSALYDAALLGTALSESREEGIVNGWSVETIHGYEEAMRYNIGDIVGMACIGVDKVFGSTALGKQGSLNASLQE